MSNIQMIEAAAGRLKGVVRRTPLLSSPFLDEIAGRRVFVKPEWRKRGLATRLVRGIEAEAVLLGQPYYMLLPEVVGVKFTGRLPEGATATDLVLHVTEMLRAQGVVGRFVEYYGEGLSSLPLADRATIANMSPEYGATIGFFPVDDQALEFFAWGARSWICAGSNFLPQEHLALYRACAVDGDFEKGRRIMSAMLPLMRVLEQGGALGNDVGRMGHGLGMQLTEGASVRAGDDTVLVPGFACCSTSISSVLKVSPPSSI